MVGFAERVRKESVPIREVSVGSTPAMAAAEHLAGVTEARTGNYVFYDRTMVLIGCCEPADVGVTVLATIVSHQPGAAHFIVDAGALELSKDPGPAHVASQAMGAVRGAPELTVATLSQEHGLIRADSPAALDGRFTVGTQVEIVPNHSSLTVPLFDAYHVIRGTGDGAGRWADPAPAACRTRAPLEGGAQSKGWAGTAAWALPPAGGRAARYRPRAAPPPPPPPPAAATPSVTVVEAVVAKSVVDRQ